MHINREHKENIPLAGRAFVLACLTESNMFTNVTWMGPDGTITSGNGITLHVQKENETTVKYLLKFLILKTSHAGNYTCISNVEDGFSTKEVTTLVWPQSKSFNCYVCL